MLIRVTTVLTVHEYTISENRIDVRIWIRNWTNVTIIKLMLKIKNLQTDDIIPHQV